MYLEATIVQVASKHKAIKQLNCWRVWLYFTADIAGARHSWRHNFNMAAILNFKSLLLKHTFLSCPRSKIVIALFLWKFEYIIWHCSTKLSHRITQWRNFYFNMTAILNFKSLLPKHIFLRCPPSKVVFAWIFWKFWCIAQHCSTNFPQNYTSCPTKHDNQRLKM